MHVCLCESCFTSSTVSIRSCLVLRQITHIGTTEWRQQQPSGVSGGILSSPCLEMAGIEAETFSTEDTVFLLSYSEALFGSEISSLISICSELPLEAALLCPPKLEASPLSKVGPSF